jgi:hypothetical protein
VIRTVLIFSLLCPAAWAQEKWDSSIMFGGVSTSAAVFAATPTQPAAATSGSVGWTWQWTSAHRFHSSAACHFYWYWEVPLVFTFGGEAAGVKRAASYFTPGVRFKIPAGTRVSFYGALGGGYIIDNEKDTLIDGQLTAVQDPSGVHPAADFGGGVDLRLNHLVSLRVDGRDYITPVGLGGTAGRNHPLFVAGIAFHM